MSTSVKRTTDTRKRLATLERELREAQTMIGELRAAIIFLNALSCRPIESLASGVVESTEDVAVGADQAPAAVPNYGGNVIPFRRRRR
jgi:ribonuclease PH